jgi:hypothetical protein
MLDRQPNLIVPRLRSLAPRRGAEQGRYIGRYRVCGRRHIRLTLPEIERIRRKKRRRGAVASRLLLKWRSHPAEVSVTWRDVMFYRNIVRRSMSGIGWSPSPDAVTHEEWVALLDAAMAPVREQDEREIEEQRAAWGMGPRREDLIWGGDAPRSLRELVERVRAATRLTGNAPP